MDDNNYMENLARAYGDKLRGVLTPELTAAVAAVEEQLALLEGLCPQRKRLLSYLRSLKQSVYSVLTADSKIIPSYRSVTPEGGLNRILNLELELFISLDTLKSRIDDKDRIALIDSVISTETRFTALLSNLR